MQEWESAWVLALYHIRTEVPGLQPPLQPVLNVDDPVPDFLATGNHLRHISGGAEVGRVGLRDAEEVNFDHDGMYQYEMREWTDVEVDTSVGEQMITIAHGVSLQSFNASPIE